MNKLNGIPTIAANPEEHGERLIGEPMAVVKEDGAPRGEKTFVFWNFPDPNLS